MVGGVQLEGVGVEGHGRGEVAALAGGVGLAHLSGKKLRRQGEFSMVLNHKYRNNVNCVVIHPQICKKVPRNSSTCSFIFSILVEM